MNLTQTFADTHVSNGADYQYVMTLDYAQKDKLGGKLGQFNDRVFVSLYVQTFEGIGV